MRSGLLHKAIEGSRMVTALPSLAHSSKVVLSITTYQPEGGKEKRNMTGRFYGPDLKVIYITSPQIPHHITTSNYEVKNI